jgi:hypothetical protein
MALMTCACMDDGNRWRKPATMSLCPLRMSCVCGWDAMHHLWEVTAWRGYRCETRFSWTGCLACDCSDKLPNLPTVCPYLCTTR